MSDGAKAALIIGGVAVGAFLIVKAIAPAPSVVPSGTAAGNTITAFVSGIVQGFRSPSKASSAPANAPLAGISSATANAPSLPEGFDTNNYQTSNGFEYTDSSGNFIAG